MADWKRIVAIDATTPSAENSFVTVNTDDSVEVVSFNDLPAIDTTGYDSVASAVGENADNYLFVVHDVDSGDHRKLSVQDFYGSIATNLLDEILTGGLISSTTNVQGIGVGDAADFNGDGSVSTADLLEFLGQFGSIVTSTPISVSVANCASTSIVENNVGTSTFDVLDLSNFTVVIQPDVQVTTNAGDDYFDIEGDGIVLADFADVITLKVSSLTIQVNGSFVGQRFRMRARVRQYNSSDALISSTNYNNAFSEMVIGSLVSTPTFTFSDVTIFNVGSLDVNTTKLRVDFEIQESNTTFGADGTPLSANIVAAEVLFDRNA